MNFELESWHSVYFLGILGLWSIYCVYRYSKIPTIKVWEVILLSSMTAFPVFMLPRIDGGEVLWIVAVSIIILASLIFQKLKQKTVGTIGVSGYLRLVQRSKNAKILLHLEDIKKVDQIVLSPIQLTQISQPPTSQTKKLREFVSVALQENKSVVLLQEFLEAEFGYTDIHENTEIPPPMLLTSRFYRFFTRVSDTVVAVILLVILSPLLLLIALAIWVYDGSPVFYTQTRVGKGDGLFQIAKFRSMQKALNGKAKPTKLGRYLRVLHIDELPQLANIFRGDMALVGPRPEWVQFTSNTNAPTNYWLRQAVRPGLTGWAQVNYRPSKNRIMRRRKLGYDVFYIKNRSFFIDALVGLRTLQKLVFFWKFDLE